MSLPIDHADEIAPASDATSTSELEALRAELSSLRDDRMRADCMASIQRDAVQLTLELLISHPDLRGFFRMFIKRLVEDSGAHACGVWLLDDAAGTGDLWMANIGGETLTSESPEWATLEMPRESMTAHLLSCEDCRRTVREYRGDDERLPEPVRAFNRASGVKSLFVAPLNLHPKTLGWIALSSTADSTCESVWLSALVEATAKQATLALYFSRLVEQSLLEARRQAVLEERNRLARDIHDTLAQGFGAILMQVQAAQRGAPALPVSAARNLETAVDLARTHLVEARRSVAALRPQSADYEDVPSALQRMVDMAQRTNDVPVDLVLEEVPAFAAGVEREIIGIAQEALTNAVRHAGARRITVHAGAVRGVGFRLSIRDDGRGIARDRGNSGFGMTSMRERADRIGASLTFVTAAREGTEVVLAWQPPSFTIPRAADARR